MSRKVDDLRVPPHDIDAEGAILSAVLVGEKFLDDVISRISPEHMYSEAHRRVLEACAQLRNEGRPVDIVTVGGLLKKAERLDQVGGMEYLMKLLDAAPVMNAKNVAAYCDTVRNAWRLRELIRRCQSFAAEAYYDVGNVDDFVDQAERSVHEVAQSGQRESTTESLPSILRRVFKDVQESGASGKKNGTSTGFAAYDSLTGGLHPGELTIIAARPAMGKSAWAAQVAAWVAMKGMGALVFSLEMPREQIAMRLLCSEARVNLWRVRNNELDTADWTRLTSGAQSLGPLAHLWVDDASSVSLAQIRSISRAKQTECTRNGKKLGVVVVDYLQLARGERDRREEVIAEISRGLKSLAKELRAPVIALSQLNRGVESRNDKRPLMSDLRESGAIEQDADVVTMLYRDDYYNADSKEPGVTELIVQKQRSGPTGTVKVHFDGQFTRFEDLPEGHGTDADR